MENTLAACTKILKKWNLHRRHPDRPYLADNWATSELLGCMLAALLLTVGSVVTAFLISWAGGMLPEEAQVNRWMIDGLVVVSLVTAEIDAYQILKPYYWGGNMAAPQQGSTGKKIYFSAIMFVVALVGCGASYGWHSWVEYRTFENAKPLSSHEDFLKKLRQYRTKRGTFPENLDGLVAEKIFTFNPTYNDREKRSLTKRNYYYLYTFMDRDRATLWALPCGERRETGNSFFLSFTDKEDRIWRGPAFTQEDLAKIKGIPSGTELALLGMIEQVRTKKEEQTTKR